MLDYTYARLSPDQQLIALQDKEKSLQIREVRSVGTLLARVSVAEHLSAFAFTPDNQYLLCASSNSKDQGGGGLVYVFKVEHSQALIRASLLRQQQQRNLERSIVVEGSQPVQQPSPATEGAFPGETRKFVVREDLFNTWAKSSGGSSGEQKGP